jgi:TonB family protein
VCIWLAVVVGACARAAPHDLPTRPGPLLPMDADHSSPKALKWKFAMYFNSVKSRVRERWHAGLAPLADGSRDGGSTTEAGERRTLLQVTLTAQGAFRDALITASSGDVALDGLAVRAFVEAQPFPTAPAELVNRDGIVQFHFALRLDRRTQKAHFTIFRYKGPDGGGGPDSLPSTDTHPFTSGPDAG